MGQPCCLLKLAYSAAVESNGCYPVAHAVGIEPVSKMCLPKTGMFQSMRGDFCRHARRKKRVGPTETNTVSEKPAVCGLFATFSQVFEITALFGWSERIRTHAFLIEPGLCGGPCKFGNVCQVRSFHAHLTSTLYLLIWIYGKQNRN